MFFLALLLLASLNGADSTCCHNQILIDTHCWPLINAGATGCVQMAQCLGMSTCKNGTCVCPSGMVIGTGPNGTSQCQTPPPVICNWLTQIMIDNACWPRVAAGGAGCVHEMQCSGMSQCVNGSCVCKQSMTVVTTWPMGPQCQPVMIDNACWPRIKPGEPGCIYEMQCSGMSYCSNGTCVCPSTLPIIGTTPDKSGPQCQTALPTMCDWQTQIMIDNACWPRIQPGDVGCVHEMQCSGMSYCSNYTCKCPPASPTIGTMPGMAQMCPPQKQCQTPPPIMCNWQTQMIIDNTCWPRINAGDSGCVYSTQCSGMSSCSNNTCVCPPGMVVVAASSGTVVGPQCQLPPYPMCTMNQVMIDNACWPHIKPGEPGCIHDMQCSGMSRCTNGTCTCPSTSPVIATMPGTVMWPQCTSPSPPLCSIDKTPIDNACWQRIKPGDHGCVHDMQCMGMSTCSNNTCVCPSTSPVIVTMPGIGPQCQAVSPVMCTFQNGNGVSQVMIENACWPTVYPGQPGCIHSMQCMGGSTCDNGTCVCMAGMTIETKWPMGPMCHSGTLIPSPPIPSAAPPNVCTMNQVLIGTTCWPTIAAGDGGCVDNAQCMGASKCAQNICVCAVGHTIVNNVCT